MDESLAWLNLLTEEAARVKAGDALTALQVTASGVAVSMSKEGKTAFDKTAKSLRKALES